MADFKIMIVEDEELYADRIEMLLDKLDYQHFGTVDNQKDVMELLEAAIPDLILMDVNINGDYDGIEVAGQIQEKFGDLPVVFMTSLQDDMTFRRASRQKPVQFLQKPFSDIQLQRTIELAIQQMSQTESQEARTNDKWENDILFKEEFYIKSKQKLIKININEVHVLEADGHYCHIHTVKNKFLVRLSLTELVKKLPDGIFIQTHRSYLVNFKQIKSVDLENSVVVMENQEVNLSKRHKDVLLEKLNFI